MKKCPYCAEEIQDEAVKCKHCGEWLQGPRPGVELSAREERLKRILLRGFVVVVLGSLLILGLVAGFMG